MTVFLGDFAEDATVDFLWNSYDADGASVTRATDGTISVYKDNGATQSTAGVTDTEDFDSLTGIHAVTIDTSADAFYATGSNYSVVLSAATIDGQTVNSVLAHFSIENRTTFPKADFPANFSALGIESDGDVTKVNALDGHTAQTGDTFAELPTNFSALGIESDGDITKVNELDGHTAQTGDTFAQLPTNFSATSIAAGGEVSADVTKVSGDSTAADNLEASLETMLVGTATGGSTTTVETGITGHGDDTFINRYMLMRTGTLQYEGAKITDYDSTTGTFTFATASWTTGATTETFVIV